MKWDLRAGLIDVHGFPRQAWSKATQAAVHMAPAAAFSYQDPRGRPELRAALADYLSRARGVYAAPDQIMTCLGTSHGIRLLGLALRRRGARRWAFESHGLTVHRDDVRRMGIQTTTVPVDQDGADVTQLGDADVVSLTPGHQFPFEHRLSQARRHEVITWAGARGALIVEDDYDGEFRFDGHSTGALQGEAPDLVAYIGTASKTLAPGLRLGWMVLPPDLLNDVLVEKTLGAGHLSALDELTFAELLRSGDYDKHVRTRRLAYRQRREELVTTLAAFRGVGLIRGNAGLSAVIRLPSPRTEDDVVAAAAKRQLAIEGLDYYRIGGAPPFAGLVVGFATPSRSTVSESFRLLAEVLGPVSW